MTRPTRLTNHICAAALGCLGFSISLFIGLWVDNPFVTVMMRGVAVLVVFYVLGFVLSLLGYKAIEEGFQAEVEAMQAEIPTTHEVDDEDLHEVRAPGDAAPRPVPAEADQNKQQTASVGAP